MRKEKDYGGREDGIVHREHLVHINKYKNLMK
jgi:hypothetical protein